MQLLKLAQRLNLRDLEPDGGQDAQENEIEEEEEATEEAAEEAVTVDDDPPSECKNLQALKISPEDGEAEVRRKYGE